MADAIGAACIKQREVTTSSYLHVCVRDRPENERMNEASAFQPTKGYDKCVKNATLLLFPDVASSGGKSFERFYFIWIWPGVHTYIRYYRSSGHKHFLMYPSISFYCIRQGRASLSNGLRFSRSTNKLPVGQYTHACTFALLQSNSSLLIEKYIVVHVCMHWLSTLGSIELINALLEKFSS